MICPSVDYRQFRLRKLNTPGFSHVWLLLFWPVFGLLFSYAERFYPVAHYFEMHCALDDLIPFNEWFLIPYLFWFVYLIGAVAYTFFFDVKGFRRMMHFVMITYSVTLIIYFLFPTCQMLRPEVFPRDNALTRFIAGFYVFDTNTNVCPSLHVIGSLAAFFSFWYAPVFSAKKWRIASAIAAFLICISTVFMKQHSVLDVLAALPLCAIAYYFAYRKPSKRARSASGSLSR
ncbi:MAG: phosphatase PAP2 family protein [Oscillospiraceae bacterium]|nr:phosphatase PAP2 family protein [Oscillospiraceae bacterium]